MIRSIYETKKLDRLSNKNIVIETFYKSFSNNQYIKSSDGLLIEPIHYCWISEKRYFYNNKFLYRIKNFSKEILYDYEEYKDENEIIKCPNCGAEQKAKNCIDGCPYCHSNFNFGINNVYSNSIKLYGSHYYNYYNLIIIFVVLSVLFFLYAILGSIVPLILILIFIILILVLYNLDKKAVVRRNEQIKNNIILNLDDKEKNVFFSNLYTELISIFYSNKYDDIIDFDIINFDNINQINDNEIRCIIKLRIVYFKNEKIFIEEKNYQIELFRIDNNTTEIENESYQVIDCPSCGNSINIMDDACEYCNKLIPKYNRWLIKKITVLNN